MQEKTARAGDGQSNIDEQEWLRAAAANPAFDFLKEPGEDIYTLADGEPFHAHQMDFSDPA